MVKALCIECTQQQFLAVVDIICWEAFVAVKLMEIYAESRIKGPGARPPPPPSRSRPSCTELSQPDGHSPSCGSFLLLYSPRFKAVSTVQSRGGGGVQTKPSLPHSAARPRPQQPPPQLRYLKVCFQFSDTVRRRGFYLSNLSPHDNQATGKHYSSIHADGRCNRGFFVWSSQWDLIVTCSSWHGRDRSEGGLLRGAMQSSDRRWKRGGPTTGRRLENGLLVHAASI